MVAKANAFKLSTPQVNLFAEAPAHALLQPQFTKLSLSTNQYYQQPHNEYGLCPEEIGIEDVDGPYEDAYASRKEAGLDLKPKRNAPNRDPAFGQRTSALPARSMNIFE